MEDPPAHAVAMPASAPAPITATPQFRQMFASLVQMLEGSNVTSNVEQRLLQLEADRDSLAAELQATRASLTSTQEILGSTRKDLAACRGLLRELKDTTGQHTMQIQGLDQFTIRLKQENVQLLNHANTNWTKVHQIEAAFCQAHQKLMEHVNNIAGQQSAKIDEFQSNIVGPFFSAMQQVIVKDTSSSRSKSPQANNSTAAAEAKAHDPNSLQTSLRDANCQNPGSSSRTLALDGIRSASFDSNTPLADVCTASSGPATALHETHQLLQQRESIARMDPPVASNGSPSSVQVGPANPNPDPRSLIQSSQTSKANDQPAAPSAIVGALLSGQADSRVDPTSGYVRIQPRPSPSPSHSPSTQIASAHSTPQTSRASSLSLSVPADPTSTPVKAATGTVSVSANMKRKRSPSVECVGMKLAKGAADETRSTSGGKGAAQQNDSAQQRRPKPAKLLSAPPFSASSREPRGHDGLQKRPSSAISPSNSSSYSFGPTHVFGRPSMIPPKAPPSPTHPPGCAKEPTSQQSAAEQAPVGGSSARSPSSPIVPSRTSQRGHEDGARPSDTMRVTRDQTRPRTNIQGDTANLRSSAEAVCANQTKGAAKIETRAGPATEASGSRPYRVPHAQSIETAAASLPARIKTGRTLSRAELDTQPSSASPATVNMTVTSSTQPSVQEAGSQEMRGDTPARRTDDEAARVVLLTSLNQPQSSGSNVALVTGPVRAFSSRAADPSTEQPADGTLLALASAVAPLLPNQTELRVKGRAFEEQAQSDALVRQSNLSCPSPRPESRASAEVSRQYEPRPRNNEGSGHRRTAPTAEEGQQSLIRCLEQRRGKPAGYERDAPSYIWAWLGDARDWSGLYHDAIPVVIDRDPVVTESLIAESLAEDLLRERRAQRINSQGKTEILELDMTWRLDTPRQFRPTGNSDRFRAERCRFVVVPRRYMKGGIHLGKNEMDRLGLRIVPKNCSPIARAYLGFDGRIDLGTCLCLFPTLQRNLSLYKPFERLCKLAEFAISRKDDPRYSLRRLADDERSAVSEMGRRQDNGWQHNRRPATPPLADRFSGTIDGLAGNPPRSRPLESRIEPSSFSDGTTRGMSSHSAAREAGSTRITAPERVTDADSATSSAVSCTRLQDRSAINTDPIPDDLRRTTSASGVVCPLDSGSPLSELDDSEDEDIKVEDVDELFDD